MCIRDRVIPGGFAPPGGAPPPGFQPPAGLAPGGLNPVVAGCCQVGVEVGLWLQVAIEQEMD